MNCIQTTYGSFILKESMYSYIKTKHSIFQSHAMMLRIAILEHVTLLMVSDDVSARIPAMHQPMVQFVELTEELTATSVICNYDHARSKEGYRSPIMGLVV